jgi:propionate CoA-transferase
LSADEATRLIPRDVEFVGDDGLFFPTIVAAVAIIRATTVDEPGNLSYEHEGG